MAGSGKKQSNPPIKTPIATSTVFFTGKQFLQKSVILIKKNFLQLVGLLFILSLLSAFLSILFFPGGLWQAYLFRQENADWLSLIESNSSPSLTPEQQQLYTSYSISNLAIRIIQWAFGFLIPSALLLFSSGKLYFDINQDPEAPPTWKKSIQRGFLTPKRAASSILILLILMLGISIGIVLYFIPGILVMAFFFYCVYAITIDEKEGREIFRGGKFYLTGNGWKTIVLIFVAFFLPWGISLFYYMPLMNLIFPHGILSEWLDPTTRNYGMLLLYFFIDFIIQYILYIWFPVIYTVVFFDFQARKIHEQQTRKNALTVQNEAKIKTIEVTIGQKDYACLICGAKMPLGQKKCPDCGEVFRVVIRRK
jgi:hypothetical protein